jgi:hypothetical protein
MSTCCSSTGGCASEHWSNPGENLPVGIILCTAKGEALVRYATDNLPTKLLVRNYLTALPDEEVIAAEIARTRRRIEGRAPRPRCWKAAL